MVTDGHGGGALGVAGSGDLQGQDLGGTLNEVCEMVISYLSGLDLGQQAGRVATQPTSKC
ncbi:hypothetical protein AB0K09_19960 [Streptomyces sp. NPDC049577]|uniref:hypothetical protein n=1 Tax=Streptomyces sp. NPDC049577 TaxID=3155153 RepID=UPI00342A42C5